jgi:hypothetical protein
MHAQELVVVHALGLKKRTLDKAIIDKFPEGLHLRNKAKILVSKLMNKKQKIFSRNMVSTVKLDSTGMSSSWKSPMIHAYQGFSGVKNSTLFKSSINPLYKV